MKEYGKVRSTKQPEQKVIDDYSVWVAANITPVTNRLKIILDEDTDTYTMYFYRQTLI